MQRQFLLFISFCLFMTTISAQTNPLYQHLQQVKVTKDFQSINIFKQAKNISQHTDLQQLVEKATIVEIESVEFSNIKRDGYDFIDLIVPLNDAEEIKVELFRQEITNKGFQYKNNDGLKLSVQQGQFYRGIVKDDPQSLVAISFLQNEIIGFISSPTLGNIIIGQLKNGDHRHVIYRESDLYATNNTTCHADVLPNIPNTQLIEVDDTKSALCGKVINIYFEADYIFYQAAGNNEQNVIDYLTGLFNIVATLYQREDIAVVISEVKVWTMPDPYSTEDAEKALFDFRDELSGNFNGDLAQLLSLYLGDNTNAPNGGLAYIDKLCQSRFLSVGYSNIDGVYSPLPRYSWDALLITHELGHGMGSEHTHRCVWGASGNQALDNCFDTEGSCAPGPQPTNGGTIMSYCHVTQDGTNLSNGFGTEPGNLIRNRVAAANCLAIGAENFSASVETFGSTTINEGDTLELIAVPNDNSYLYQWYKDNTIVLDEVTSIYEVIEAGDYYVEIAKNGCTELSNTVSVSTQSLQVNLSCSPNDCSTCNGQKIILDAGVDAATYEWSTGATTRTIEVTSGSNYAVTVTSNGNTANGATTVQFTTQSRTDQIEICEGESYEIGNSTYQNTGTYTDFITNINGCVVEVTTQLTVHTNVEENNVVNICAGESITVGNSTYQQSGNYTDILMTDNGCERRINTMLTVFPTYRNEQDITICEGGNYTIGNSTYTTTGTFEDRFSTINNCDSIIITHLSVAENYNIEQNINLCQGESITVGNSIYNATGMYEDELIASDGCDSIITTNLTVFSIFDIENVVSICTGESVFVGNSVYTETGTYRDVLSSSNGCDSIITTQLTVFDKSDTQQNISICQGQTITVGNSTYASAGTYVDVLSNSNGCDSTVTTQLVISDEILVEENINLCYGTEYQGQVFTENATFTNMELSASGCDSTHILNILVNSDIQIDFDISNINCTQTTGSVSTTITGDNAGYQYQWSNGATTAHLQNVPAGTYHLLLTDSNGCTQTATAIIENQSDVQIVNTVTPISCAGENDATIDVNITSGMPPFSIFWSNGPLTEDQENIGAGSYTLFITDANDCQFDTTFIISNPEPLAANTSFTSTNSNTGTASVTASGGTMPYSYLWSNGATTATIINLTIGTYTVTITDANGCILSSEVTVEMLSSTVQTTDIQSFEIYPNPNQGQFDIDISLAERQDIKVLIYNMMGQQIHQSILENQQNIKQQMNLPTSTAGVYWLVLKTENGQVSKRFIIK